MPDADLLRRVEALERRHLNLVRQHAEHQEAMGDIGRSVAAAPPLDRITLLERRVEGIERQLAQIINKAAS